MTREKFEEILEDDVISVNLSELEDDNSILGLLLIRKYLPNKGIGAAEHDIIFSEADIDELLEAGLTEEDAVELRSLNWMIDEDSLACFV